MTENFWWGMAYAFLFEAVCAALIVAVLVVL
jgi:hypothetical protein